MNGSLAVKQNFAVEDWGSLRTKAETFIKSGLAPQSIRTPEQAIIVAMTGKELGFSFMASMRAINVIQNQAHPDVQGKLALAMATKELEDFKIERKVDEVVATVKRKGRSAITTSFGKKEAIAMKLIGKDNYEKQPMTMYQWRALGAALDIAFADVLLGVNRNFDTIEEGAIVEGPVIDNTSFVTSSTTNAEVPYTHTVSQDPPSEPEPKPNEPAPLNDMADVIRDITDKLAAMNEGNIDAMDAHLSHLTKYTDKKTGREKSVEHMSSLPRIADSKPQWLFTIHRKVNDDYAKFGAKDEPQSQLPL